MTRSYLSHTTEYWPSDCMVGGFVPLNLYEYDMSSDERSPQEVSELETKSDTAWFKLFIFGVLLTISSVSFITIFSMLNNTQTLGSSSLHPSEDLIVDSQK